MSRYKENKGITLIVLLVTVVIILIIASISLKAIDKGLITNTKETKKEAEITSVIEKIRADIYEEHLKKNRDLTQTEITEIIKKYGNIVTDQNGDIVKIKTKKGNHEISIEDIYKQVIEINNGWNEEKGVNSPILKDGMELVKYDEASKNWVVDPTNSEYEYVKEMGNNDNRQSKWANGRLNGNYYVWIPRYAYKIDNSVTYTTQGGRNKP